MVKRKKEVVKKKNCCKVWDEKVKRFGYCDISYIKFASIAFVLFLITIWTGLRNLLLGIHWAWYLALMLIFSIKPAMKFFKK